MICWANYSLTSSERIRAALVGLNITRRGSTMSYNALRGPWEHFALSYNALRAMGTLCFFVTGLAWAIAFYRGTGGFGPIYPLGVAIYLQVMALHCRPVNKPAPQTPNQG